MYTPVLTMALIYSIITFSQYVTFRVGIFSVGSAGFAALGAYTTGLLTVKSSWPPAAAILAGVAMGGVAATLLGFPIARLRGVYQAVATLAFVVVLQSLVNVFTDFTGGPDGLNGIPQALSTTAVIIIFVVVTLVVRNVFVSRAGLALDALRGDETAARSCGVSLRRYHVYMYVLSGALGGLGGSMLALYNFSISPDLFGFTLVLNLLTYVIFGGVGLVLGPVVGTLLFIMFPILVPELQDYVDIVEGAVVIAVLLFLRDGVVTDLWHVGRELMRRLNRHNEEVQPTNCVELEGSAAGGRSDWRVDTTRGLQ